MENSERQNGVRSHESVTAIPARVPIYRHASNHSSASVFEDVEMAQDELYAGPVAESLPTSVSAFSHRRTRADSTASFAFHDQNSDDGYEDVDQEDLSRRQSFATENGRFVSNDSHSLHDFEAVDDIDSLDQDIEDARENYSLYRRSSSHSHISEHARLLRSDSAATGASSYESGRLSQKVYMINEDLTIAIAGFRTSRLGYLIYALLCIATGGIAFLLFRWLPRWYVNTVGRPCRLRDCTWVVIENQWGEMVIMRPKVQLYGRPLSTVFGESGEKTTVHHDFKDDPILDELRSIDYRYVRLCFNPLLDKFMLCIGWKDPQWTDVRMVRSGLDADEKVVRETIFGNNLIDIEQKPLTSLLVDEVLHPFYVFQIASLILWSLDSYYYYAACILLMSIASIATTLFETRATMKRLRQISRFECDVRVLRNGFWKYVNSGDLVPGDVYELSDPNLAQFPSDSLLLTGDCIVNESMLTGESVPVSKVPSTDETLSDMDLSAPSVSSDIARHFLFCGTKIIRTRRPQDDQDGDGAALALVVRTGFNTTKGSLVRSMLFPKPSGFKFYQDSFRYISVMACIAMVGFVASLINFIRLELAWHLIIVRALDLITIVVPPALPATLTIGTNFALSRLKARQIFCISPQRVNVGGKVDVMCFDKTGTLTEEGLDVLGVRVVSGSTKRFTEVISDPKPLEEEDSASQGSLRAALHTMATCHSLRLVDGELIGDPLDQKMFEFTNWTFEEGRQVTSEGDDDEQGGLTPSVAKPPHGGLELGVLKSFEFASNLRRASVIVRHFGKKSGDIYVKGAPEAMREICRPDSFPTDYDELLSYYTHKGYRVIGCASKHINKLSWVKAQKMTRAEAECDLDFVGFIIFENKLKPTTAGVLEQLKASNIGLVMVTGDNILTAISVARECGLINRSAHCFLPRFVQGDSNDPLGELQWESIDDDHYRLDGRTLMPCPAPPDRDVSLPFDISDLRDYSLAVSGDVFRWVIDYGTPDLLNKILVRGKIFARMSPDEKHELVEKLQSLDYTCGFCGDGANDCGALKAADIGISLSEAEASVAAPFTSRVFDIRCVVEVIKEGRAALVTSFSCFKYMSLYSAIQFTSVSFLYAKASNLGDFQFLFIDLLLILPIAIFMGWAGPAPKLSQKRPTANLVSRKVLIPLLGLMTISVVIQTIAYITVREQPWYKEPKLKHEHTNIRNSENTALFLMSCFEYIFSGVVLNAGAPFRDRILRNWPFVFTIIAALLISLYMVLIPAHWVKKTMQLTYMSLAYEGFLILLGFTYLGASWAFEKHLAMPLAKLFRRLNEALTGQSKKRKAYKVIEEEMRF